MSSALLVMLREGVEAALIIAILLAYLNRVGRRDVFVQVWRGTGAAALLAMAAVLGRSLAYSPNMTTPWSPRRVPAAIRMRVVFPDPFRPINVTTFPASPQKDAAVST